MTEVATVLHNDSDETWIGEGELISKGNGRDQRAPAQLLIVDLDLLTDVVGSAVEAILETEINAPRG